MCGQGKIKIILLCLENQVFLKVFKKLLLTFEKKNRLMRFLASSFILVTFFSDYSH